MLARITHRTSQLPPSLAAKAELTSRRDALNAERRQLPMVRVEKEYTYDGPDGPVTLAELFGDRMQLITWHIMFGPDWDAACPSCTNFMNELSPAALARLRDCQTAFALISRAPLAKIEEYQASKGWTLPWYSSYGSDFNYDFQVTLDESVGQVSYNYRPEPGLLRGERSTEMDGASCFQRDGSEIFHTYSAYARGLDHTDWPYALLHPLFRFKSPEHDIVSPEVLSRIRRIDVADVSVEFDTAASIDKHNSEKQKEILHGEQDQTHALGPESAWLSGLRLGDSPQIIRQVATLLQVRETANLR